MELTSEPQESSKAKPTKPHSLNTHSQALHRQRHSRSLTVSPLQTHAVPACTLEHPRSYGHGKEGQTFCFSHRLTYAAVTSPIAQRLEIKVCFSRTLPVHHQLAEARFSFPFPGIQAKRATTLCLWHRERVLRRLSQWHLNTSIRDASGSPVVKNSILPMQGVQV